MQSPIAPLASTRRAASALVILTTALFLVAGFSQPAYSQTYTVIHNFTNKGSDGADPYGGPILDRSGNLYGTTYLGGTFGAGSVYKLSPNGSSWTYSSLHSFKGISDGSGPAFGSLAVDAQGRLFGTTEGGLNFGTAFAVCSCALKEAIIHRFGSGTDGAQPIGGLAVDSAGNLYGTTSLGGTYGNGTIFEAKRTGQEFSEHVIYSFIGGDDGFNPVSGVTVGADGNLYGTTSLGGAFGDGVVFKLSPSGPGWTETVLYTFQGLSDGQNPVGGVVLDPAGNIYGSTFFGGDKGGGTVYELSLSGGSWALTNLYSFSTYYGPYNKLTLDASGNIYGTANGAGAYGFGSVFKLTPGHGGWTFTDLYDFPGGDNGSLPYGSVAVDANGNVFGTASVGGTENQGLVFEITP